MSQMYKIFVGNVNFTTTEDQIKEIFEPHITIEDIVIARDEETGKSRGYAFVMTRDPDQGRRAMRTIGKFELDGRLVYLQESHGGKKPPKKPRRGGPRGPRRGEPRRGPRPDQRNDSEGGSGYSNPSM